MNEISRRGLISLLGLAAALTLPATIAVVSGAHAQDTTPPPQTGTQRRQERRTNRTERRQERRAGRTERRTERQTGRTERRQKRQGTNAPTSPPQ